MTPAMRALDKVAQDFVALQEARDETLVQLQAAIRAADAEGNPRADIIRVARVAKQTVYDALREPDPDDAEGTEP